MFKALAEVHLRDDKKPVSIAHIETSPGCLTCFFFGFCFFGFCIERYIEEELNVVEVNFKADAEAGHEKLRLH